MNNRVISSFREGFIFAILRIREVSRKYTLVNFYRITVHCCLNIASLVKIIVEQLFDILFHNIERAGFQG